MEKLTHEEFISQAAAGFKIALEENGITDEQFENKLNEWRMNFDYYPLIQAFNTRMGNRIKELREAKGWSLKQLSQLSDLPLALVRGIENADSEYEVDIVDVYDIACALNVEVTDLCDEEG